MDLTCHPPTHHCQGHAINLMLVFGLVLPKGAVSGQEVKKTNVKDQEWEN